MEGRRNSGSREPGAGSGGKAAGQGRGRSAKAKPEKWCPGVSSSCSHKHTASLQGLHSVFLQALHPGRIMALQGEQPRTHEPHQQMT